MEYKQKHLNGSLITKDKTMNMRQGGQREKARKKMTFSVLGPENRFLHTLHGK